MGLSVENISLPFSRILLLAYEISPNSKLIFPKDKRFRGIAENTAITIDEVLVGMNALIKKSEFSISISTDDVFSRIEALYASGASVLAKYF